MWCGCEVASTSQPSQLCTARADGWSKLAENDEQLLRLEVGLHGPGEITLLQHLGRIKQLIGRGFLPANSSELVHLRIERAESRCSAYCSRDGKAWFTVGHVDFPMEGAVQVGMHAIGMIDRTIYTGVDENGMSYPEGTAIRFEDFRLWKR